MKVLLTAINAKYIHSNLAVYSLAAYAHKYKAHVQLAEYTINHMTDDIVAGIYKEKPDVVVFSCYIWNISMVLDAARTLKAVAPQMQIWLGGPEVSFDSEHLLETYPMIDGVMRGEGEVVFLNMMTHWVDGTLALSDVCGITYRDGARIVSMSNQPLMNMDDVPFIYEDLSLFENKIIYYESSRGCPYSCSYCLSSVDKSVRFKSVSLVKKELQILIDARVKQVKFVDRTFNCRHSHTKEIWQYLLENDNGVTNFHFEITADLLDDEELELLSRMRPGLVQLEIGVQSTCPLTITEIRRNVDFRKLKAVVDKVHEADNVHQHLDLIAGLPYEDFERFKKSFDDVYRLAPQQLQLGFLKVLKGSLMHKMQQAYGLVYRDKPPYEVIRTNWISFDEILYLKSVEQVLEIFYNSHQFEMSVAYLEHLFDTPFELYGALAECFAEHGWDKMSCTRMVRYEQLLIFGEAHGGNRELLKELLTYDLYAREHLKSRPAWVRSLDEIKAGVAAFYSEPENVAMYMASHQGENYRTLRHLTHLEPFRFDLWTSVKKGMPVCCDSYVLFDYTKKNPLTGEAGITWITTWKGQCHD